MSRKEIITKEVIIEAAFIMTREEGFVEVTARKLARKIGCSTQPIFRIYSGMTELGEELFIKSIAYFQDYYRNFDKNNQKPFVDLGRAYIRFALEEKHLFNLLFLSEQRGTRSMYELLNGDTGILNREINNARMLRCKDPSGLFMKMWIFIHGIACMTITGDYDLSEEETIVLLKESYDAFMV